MTSRFHLILCGEDKGFDFVDVIIAAHKKAELVIVFGDISHIISSISTQLDPNYPFSMLIQLKRLLNSFFHFLNLGIQSYFLHPVQVMINLKALRIEAINFASV